MHTIMLKLMYIHSSHLIYLDQTSGYLQGGKLQGMNTLKVITKLAEYQNQHTHIKFYICVLALTCDPYILHIRHVISIQAT